MYGGAHGTWCCRSRLVCFLLESREDIVDGFEGIVQIFGRAAVAEELVTVRVFDEKVGVGDVVSELSDFVEA